MKKILIVGFEKENQINYPHLRQTISYLEQKMNCEYSYFFERGYFLNCKFSLSIKTNVMKTISFFKFFIGFIGVFFTRVFCKYDTVVVIDNFTYVVYSLFFKNTILWSHDFVTNDQEQSNCIVQKIIKQQVYKYIRRNKKIIIQDTERLSLLLEDYIEEDIKYLDIFYFPVSLLSIEENNKNIDNMLPILMQIGGINKFRSGSDVLLKYYQIMHNKFNLIFHGYFMSDMIDQINRSRYIPISSTLEMLPDEVYKIVEKCDIGFICYNTNNKNFYHTKHASGQLVEFIRCAKPVIIIGNTDLKLFVNKEKIGVSIEIIEELESAISKISNNYQFYKENARKCFESTYDIKLYLSDLGKWIIYDTQDLKKKNAKKNY